MKVDDSVPQPFSQPAPSSKPAGSAPAPPALAVLAIVSWLIPGAAVAQKAPLIVTLTAPRTVTMADDVLVQVTTTNVSDHPIQVWVNFSDGTSVHHESGKELPWRPGARGNPMRVDLEPGAAHQERIALNNRFSLQPGTCIVQVERSVNIDDPKAGIVKSNKIAITVLPRNLEGHP